MRVKKHKKNEYLLADDIWVRNPNVDVDPIDINKLNNKDIEIILRNEIKNLKISSMYLDDLYHIDLSNLIIFSDGYLWSEKQKILGSISNEIVKTIGLNGSLSKWDMVGDQAKIKRTMTFYLVNNPYEECLSYLPKKHRYYPNLIASTKTNYNFVNQYKSEPFFYKSTKNLNYSGPAGDYLTLDDYRNPICAALSFAYKRKAKKIVLFCCDDAFKDERPGSIKMKNGLYQYPQQIKCQKIIDKQIFWLKKSGIEIFDCSSGIDYDNAEYIDEERLLSFFN